MNPHLLRSRLVAALLGATVVLLTGCDTTAKTYTVQVDAIAAPAESGKPPSPAQSYHIRSTNPQINEDSLRYKEVADYVRTALSGKGMYEAPSPEKADVIIDIDYGMDAPRIKFEKVSTPIIVRAPGRFRTETDTVMRRQADGTVVPVNVQTRVFEPGALEIKGDQESVQPLIVYEKHLKVSARTNQEVTEGRAPPEVWSVNVSAEDESQEFRKYMPVLASATADYIGTNTKEEKPVKINEGDETVTFIRKGL